MESLRGMLEGLDLPKLLAKRETERKPENCMTCGTVLEWKAPAMFQQRCPVCGILIIASGRVPEKKTQCYGCFDGGWCSYKVQIDGFIYELNALCICQKGQEVAQELTPKAADAKHRRPPFINEARCAPSFDEIVRRNREICKGV